MAVLLVILIGIVLSMIPFFIDKGKEQIQVKKVKDTFYTMTGSKFFSDTLLGKHFANAMKNKGYNYQRTLTSGNVKEIKDELYRIAFDYAVKKKMVWGKDDYTKAVIQFCNSNDSVIQRAYDMIIAEKRIVQSAKESIEHDGMPWITPTSHSDLIDSTFTKPEGYHSNNYKEEYGWELKKKWDKEKNEEEFKEIISHTKFEGLCLTLPSSFEYKQYETLMQLNYGAIHLNNNIEGIDGKMLNKFKVVIIPTMNDIKFKRLLLDYNGIVIEESFKGDTWIGSEMTLSAFCTYHGESQFKVADSKPYLLAKDGTRLDFSQELIDLYNNAKNNKEKFQLDLSKLKAREYFSMIDKKFHFKAYYNYKK